MAIPNAGLGEILQSRFLCVYEGQIAINIGHYRVTATAGAMNLQTVADLAAVNLVPLYAACMGPGSNAVGIGFRRLDPAPVTVEYYNNTEAEGGSASGATLPGQVSGIISYYTDLAGKRNRGRNYIPFPVTSFLASDGTPAAGYVATLSTLAISLKQQILIDGVNSITLSRVIWPGSGPLTNIVSRMRVQDKWATQRRRGNYGQLNSPPF